MNIVIVGHVDHGKSTLIGRLLADTHSLPEGKLQQVKENCERSSKPFEYAFLLDALKDEQDQGITIDSARVFFKTQKRSYTIIDAPGHIEFLKNMISGAARASAALLVIDGHEGIQENSRRHGYLLSLLGIQQIAVLVNKMDLLNYDSKKFSKVCEEYHEFLKQVGVEPKAFIPVAAFHGENLIQKSNQMSWYKGGTVLEALDDFEAEALPSYNPFRMPVQDVYKFTKGGDSRRIVAGTIESGQIQVGDLVVFFPSGKKSSVKTIEALGDSTQNVAKTGCAIGFTLTEQIYVSRGDVAAIAGQPAPSVSTLLKVSLFWLGKSPMRKSKNYILKLGTAKVDVKLEEIFRLLDTSQLSVISDADEVPQNSAAECLLKLDRAIAVDLATSNSNASRFVIVDEYDINGGGIVREVVEDNQYWVRKKVIRRNLKWEPSYLSLEDRAERYNQRPTLIIITSSEPKIRKETAKKLEVQLFSSGRSVYFLGIASSLYGVGADIKENEDPSAVKENLRRFGEVVNVLLDSGMIVIATLSDLSQEQLELFKVAIGPERIETIWIGEEVETPIAFDLKVSMVGEDIIVQKVKRYLQDKGVIFNPGRFS